MSAVPGESQRDSAELAELSAIIQAVRGRVRARYPEPDSSGADSGLNAAPVADLLPLVHARDAAQAKIAAIGSVNPRAGGLLNRAIQQMKRAVARALQWFVRDQITFNREVVAALDTILEVLNEHNRAAREVKDIRGHWTDWRADWERRLASTEIQFLRSVADYQGAFQHRLLMMESNFREVAKAQHADYLGALDRTTVEIQKKLWLDFQKVRAEYGQMIHDELRIIRLRQLSVQPGAGVAPSAVLAASPARPPDFDQTRFAFRFRGPEKHIRQTEEFYKPFFANCRNVLDVGCGRGEFLELMRETGIPAKGIDLGAESVAQCHDKGLDAEVADLFAYLGPGRHGEFDGIFASQIVEHLDPAKLPEMIRLCAAGLRRGGVLAIETPNPDCLAIFATYFYIDPTHSRPVPRQLLEFYMEESGIGSIEVHELSPAIESIPEIAELPEAFRKRFFGGLDYVIIGRKL
jgi:2-polyprenyl-3-methyl-5-hydroxy-6-metoxy-1,4-benzoquinol methylase